MSYMKHVDTVTLVDRGNYTDKPEFAQVTADIEGAIAAIVHPIGTDKFIINDQQVWKKDSSKKNGGSWKWYMNGVLPIKNGFTSYLSERGWEMEYRDSAKAGEAVPGAFDCHYTFPDTDLLPFAVEWETGNISSSHRAINRLAVGIRNGNISGGFLVLPTGAMKKLLTDRIGNSPELAPYIDLWRGEFTRLTDKPFFLGFMTVEHDGTSADVPYIPKGDDGRAKTMILR